MAYLLTLAHRLTARVEADDLPGAARELRRLEWEIAREIDRRNAPRGQVAAGKA